MPAFIPASRAQLHLRRPNILRPQWALGALLMALIACGGNPTPRQGAPGSDGAAGVEAPGADEALAQPPAKPGSSDVEEMQPPAGGAQTASSAEEVGGRQAAGGRPLPAEPGEGEGVTERPDESLRGEEAPPSSDEMAGDAEATPSQAAAADGDAPPAPARDGDAAAKAPDVAPEARAGASSGPATPGERAPLSDREMLELLDDSELGEGEFERAFADQRKDGVKLPGAPQP